jgi:tRNA pseudouridine38-40 synthase
MESRYRATVEYDGHDFLGFQYQARGRTVQGELEKAIERVAQQRVRVAGAGRTDAGVHAIGQVIAFTLDWRHTAQDLWRALNAVLPREIAISELSDTHPRFHPRFDALWRQYRYTVLNQEVRSPLWCRYAHQVPGPLDVETMSVASRYFVGSHDFTAFGQPTQGTSTVREIMQAEWLVDGKRLEFEIRANAFLRHMARTIVGTLLQVGRGRLKPEAIVNLLESGDRAAAGPPAPANGLCLVKIGYAD